MSDNHNEDRDDLNKDVEETEEHQDEGPQKLSIPEADFRNLKGSLTKANKEAEKRRKEAKELRERLEAYEQYGDPDELGTIVKQFQEGTHERDDNLVHKTELDKLRKSMQAKQQELETERDTLVEQTRGKYERTIIQSEAKSAIAKYEGVPEFLLGPVSQQMQLVESDGKYEFRVVDDEGEPRFNNKGEYMSPVDLVQELREDPVFGRAFPAPNKSGTGIKNQGSNREGAPPKRNRSEMKQPEKLAFIKEYGIAEYNKLPN